MVFQTVSGGKGAEFAEHLEETCMFDEFLEYSLAACVFQKQSVQEN